MIVARIVVAWWMAGLVAAVQARPFVVLVYNVENLFDADGEAAFEDYQPARYSRAHVLTKLRNISEVVARFEGGGGPDIIFFQEIEADRTPGGRTPDYDAILRRYAGVRIEDMLGAGFNDEVADLPAEALLAKAMADRGVAGYRVIVGEGTRTAETTRALAQTCVVFTRFPVKQVRSHATLDARAILEVQVEVEGAPLYLFNNHWKSGANDAATEKVRVENARTLRQRLTEILRQDPHADVILAGDFNSHYNQKVRHPALRFTGINDVLGSQGNELAVRGTQRDLYNLWFELPVEERGSDAYRGEWGTLMQMLVTRGLYDYRGVQYVDNSFGVAKIPGLNVDAKGLPRRWSFSGAAGEGVSDHFPIYAKFLTVPDNRVDRWVSLRRASVEAVTEGAAPKIDFAGVDLERVAVKAKDVPGDTSLRSDEFRGRIVRVEGKVGPSRRLTVSFLGEIYDIWSFDEALRAELRERHKAGGMIRFYGELGQYKERWQFVIHDRSWVK